MKDAGWFPQVSSSASLIISLLALTFTGLTFRDRRRQDRRDLFLKLHERLVEPDLQRGRRLVFTHARTVAEVRNLRERQAEEFDLINRALAMFDIAGLYVAKGYVDKRDFLGEWGVALGRTWLAAGPFLEVRFDGGRGWSHFRALGQEAAGALEPTPSSTPETADESA